MSRLCPLDISFAVVARRILFFEVSTGECRSKEIWEPTQKKLEELADQMPAQVVCLASKPYRLPEERPDSQCIDLYMTALDNLVLYLGTVFNTVSTKMYAAMPSRTPSFAACNMVRDDRFCAIPMPECSNIDTREALSMALRRYLRVVQPRLSKCAISWYPEEVAFHIDEMTMREAERTAKKPTHEERWHAVTTDFVSD